MQVQIVDAVRAIAWGGSTAIAVWLLALVGEKWAWYQTLSPQVKRLFMFALSAVIALVAWAAVKYVPDATWVQLQEPFTIVMMILAAIFGNQLVHRVGPKLGQVASDMDRIREAGMLVPLGMITPSMVRSVSAEVINNETNQLTDDRPQP